MKSPFRGIEPKTYVSVISFGAIAGSGHGPARHGARMLLASPLPVYQTLTFSLFFLMSNPFARTGYPPQHPFPCCVFSFPPFAAQYCLD